MLTKSARPALTSRKQPTVPPPEVFSTHSIIGYTPVEMPAARTAKHLSVSPADVVHHLLVVEQIEVPTGAGRSGICI